MKLTLGNKLGLGFGVVLILMVTSAMLAYLKPAEIKNVQDFLITVRVPTIERTSHGAADSQRAAQQLAHMSTELRELVGQFKY